MIWIQVIIILQITSLLNKKYESNRKFKGELGGRIMSELVFLRSKAYTYLVENKDAKN